MAGGDPKKAKTLHCITTTYATGVPSSGNPLNMNISWIMALFSEFYDYQCIEYTYFLNYKALRNIFGYTHLISVINWEYSNFFQYISLNCAFSLFKFNYTFISTQFTNLFTHSYIAFVIEVIYMIWNMLLQLWPHHQTFVFCLVCWVGHVTLPFLYSCTISWITLPILHFSACNLACGYP